MKGRAAPIQPVKQHLLKIRIADVGYMLTGGFFCFQFRVLKGKMDNEKSNREFYLKK